MKTIWERFTDGFTLKKDHMDRTWRCHLFFWNLQYSSTDRNYRRRRAWHDAAYQSLVWHLSFCYHSDTGYFLLSACLQIFGR